VDKNIDKFYLQIIYIIVPELDDVAKASDDEEHSSS